MSRFIPQANIATDQLDGVMSIAIDAGVRRSIEEEIERLISLLDVIDPDPDLEPYLAGGAEIVDTDDREGDASDDEDGTDAEFSLGWVEPCSQGRDAWERGGCQYIAGADSEN